VSLEIVALLAQLMAGDAAHESVPAASPEGTVPLRALVLDALRYNLTLRSASASTRSIETGVQASKSAFDPQFQVSPLYANTPMMLLAQPGVVLSGTQETNQVSSGLSGTLPFSTQYSVSLQTSRQTQTNAHLLAPGILSPSVNSTLTLTLAQPLLRGRGRSLAQAPVDLASLAGQSARARLGRTSEQTIAAVESGYWSLGLAQAVERISRDSYHRAQELMARNEKMRELKLIAEVDAITSRRGVQQRLTSLTEATRQRQDAAERLIFLVYGEYATDRLKNEPALNTEAPAADLANLLPVADLEERALRERRDYQAAKLDLSQSEILKRVARNSLQPDARLTTSFSSETLGTDSFRLSGTSRPGDLEQSDWRVGLNISYPLGNRAAKAAYAKARYDTDVQSASLAAAEAQVRSEVRAAARAIEADRERLAQASLSFTYAKEQYEAGQAQLRLGLIDSFRLLQMEEDVANAELVLEQTRYDLAIALSSFGLAMGTSQEQYLTRGPNPSPR
jgi:outer membrane protein TolC